jgi:hypothetical protein
LEEQDWDRWSPLWHGYLNFYRAELSEETTRSTFGRLCDEVDGMFGFLSVNDGGDGIGLAHCLVHPTTWSGAPTATWKTSTWRRKPGGGISAEHSWRKPSAPRLSATPVASTGIPSSTTAGPDRSDQVGRPTSFVVYEM